MINSEKVEARKELNSKGRSKKWIKKTQRVGTALSVGFIVAIFAGTVYISTTILSQTTPVWALLHSSELVKVVTVLHEIDKIHGSTGLNQALAAYTH